MVLVAAPANDSIALFSASEQTHCALAVCESERETAALHRSGVLTVLFGCYMAGAT